MDKDSLLTTCGLYCGACPHYLANFAENAHLLEEQFRGDRPLEGFTCAGCHSERLYVHPGCQDCAIRDCAAERGLAHCGLCPELPCTKLVTFMNDGHEHHVPICEQLAERARMGNERWAAEQARRWRCSCGQATSWWETKCARCGREKVC